MDYLCKTNQHNPLDIPARPLGCLGRLFPTRLDRLHPFNRPFIPAYRSQSSATPQSAEAPGQRHARLQPPALTAILRPMQPQALTFDTHDFVKRLTRAGMPEDQAEVLSKGQSDLYERLVTKEYFEFTLKHELEKLRAELKNDIEKLKAELKHDIEKLRAELTHDIEKVRAELEATKTELKRDIKEMEQKLTIKLGAFLGISVTVLALIIKFA